MKYVILHTIASLFLLSMATVEAAGNNAKEDICHFDKDAGLFHVINISSKAVLSHLSKHGDHYAGEFFEDADGDGLGDFEAQGNCLNPGLSLTIWMSAQI